MLGSFISVSLFVVDNVVVGIILLSCLVAVTVSLIYGTILVCVRCIFNVFNKQFVTCCASVVCGCFSWFLPRELCSRGICHGRVSVCVCLSVSVTSRCCTKMAKHRNTQTTPHDSPGTLVF